MLQIKNETMFLCISTYIDAQNLRFAAFSSQKDCIFQEMKWPGMSIPLKGYTRDITTRMRICAKEIQQIIDQGATCIWRGTCSYKDRKLQRLSEVLPKGKDHEYSRSNRRRSPSEIVIIILTCLPVGSCSARLRRCLLFSERLNLLLRRHFRFSYKERVELERKFVSI